MTQHSDSFAIGLVRASYEADLGRPAHRKEDLGLNRRSKPFPPHPGVVHFSKSKVVYFSMFVDISE
jgi:hypothetical protein